MKSPRVVSLLALALGAAGLTAVLGNPATLGRREIDPGLPIAVGPRGTVPPPVGDSASDPVELPAALVRRTSVAVRAIPGETPDAPRATGAMPGEAPRAVTLAELQDFREYVAGTLSEMRRQEAADGLRALEERAASLDLSMSTLEERLGLTPAQSDRLRSALLSQFDREAEYLRLQGEDADEEILAELKARDRKALVDELSSFLTAEQVETHLALE